MGVGADGIGASWIAPEQVGALPDAGPSIVAGVVEGLGFVVAAGEVLFGVVVDFTHEDDIERIARLGITVGCSVDPPLYCPDDPVTRAEMAAFLLRAVGQPRPTPVNTGQYVDCENMGGALWRLFRCVGGVVTLMLADPVWCLSNDLSDTGCQQRPGVPRWPDQKPVHPRGV